MRIKNHPIHLVLRLEKSDLTLRLTTTDSTQSWVVVETLLQGLLNFYMNSACCVPQLTQNCFQKILFYTKICLSLILIWIFKEQSDFLVSRVDRYDFNRSAPKCWNLKSNALLIIIVILSTVTFIMSVVLLLYFYVLSIYI